MIKHKKSLCLATIGLGLMFSLQYNLNNNPFYTGVLPAFSDSMGKMTDTYLDATNTFAKAASGFSPQGKWNATKLGWSNGLKSIGLDGLDQSKPSSNGWSGSGWTNSSGNISGAGIAGIAALGAGMVTNMLAGQNSTAAGNVMNKLGDVASVIPGPYGAIISGGLKIAGGLTNAMFGSHLNQEFIDNKTKEMSSVASSSSDALNTTDFANDFSLRQGVTGFSKKDVGSDGWFSHKARNKYRSMLAASNAANNQSLANLNSVGRQINQRNTMSQLSNLTALGGPLEYGLALDYINNGLLSAQSKNRMYSLPNLGVQAGLFAFGGDVQGDGGDYPTGLTHIDAGDTHEANPYEGVQLGVDAEGVPNLVEQNEVVYDDYVFSARLVIPKQKVKKGEKATREQRLLNRYKGLTYADAAKKIEHNTGVDERPNDPIAKRGFEADLQILAMSQEKERAAQELKDQKKQIDNMSAEEFALRQALQQALELLLQLLAILALLAALNQVPLQEDLADQTLPQDLQVELLEQVEQPDVNLQLPLEQAPDTELPDLQLPDLQYADGGLMAQQGNDTNANAQNTVAQSELSLNNDLAALQESILSSQEQQLKQLQQDLQLLSDSLQSAEDMSTSQLNQTIDLILLWARSNGDKELAKQARKARRASREDKEDFVDEALDDILERELQAQLELEQQLEQLLSLQQELQQDIALQLWPVEQQDQTLLFALGGSMSPEQLLQYIQTLQAFMQQVGLSQDQDMQQYYKQYSDLVNNKQTQQALLFADNLYRQYVKAQQGQLYSLGGSMSLKNQDLNVYAGTPIDITKDTDGNYSNSNDKSIGTARKLHTRLFQQAIRDKIALQYALMQQAVKDKDWTKVRQLRKGLISKWNNVNQLYSVMQSGDEVSVKALQNAFNDLGLNENLTDDFLKDIGIKKTNTGKAYLHDDYTDGRLGAITANRYLDIDALDDNAQGLLKSVGVAWNPWGDTDNTNYYTRLNDNSAIINRIANPAWEKLSKTQRAAEMAKPDGIKPTITLDEYVKDNPDFKDLDTSKPLTQELIDLLFNKSGDLTPIDATTDLLLWTYTPDDNKETPDKVDEYPMPSLWPYLGAAGLNAGLTAYNLIKGPDYGNAEGMINASKDAAKYTPIGARYAGQEYFYNPVSNTYLEEPILSEGQSTLRGIMNSSNGNTGALMSGLLQNNHNVGLQLADAYIRGTLYNNDQRLKAQLFGLQRDTSNYDRQLKADMANLEAEQRGRASRLEGTLKGYALREQIANDRGKTISAGLQGIINPLLAYEQSKYAGQQTGWYGRNVARPGVVVEGTLSPDGTKEWHNGLWRPVKAANGGKLRTVRVKRPKGLMF